MYHTKTVEYQRDGLTTIPNHIVKHLGIASSSHMIHVSEIPRNDIIYMGMLITDVTQSDINRIN